MSEVRIPPIDDTDALDDEAREILERTSVDGRVLNIFRTLIRHPKLMKRWMVFANHILAKSTLSPRERELLILRTAHRCGADYEWGQHVLIASAIGFMPDEIERIAEGPSAGWDDFEAALLRSADELVDDHRVGDATWQTLRTRFDDRQMMDALFTVGQYAMLAGALNSFGVPLDDGVPAR